HDEACTHRAQERADQRRPQERARPGCHRQVRGAEPARVRRAAVSRARRPGTALAVAGFAESLPSASSTASRPRLAPKRADAWLQALWNLGSAASSVSPNDCALPMMSASATTARWAPCGVEKLRG